MSVFKNFPEASYNIVVSNKFRHYTVNFEVHKNYSDTGFMNDVYYLLSTVNPAWYSHSIKNLITIRNERKSGFEMQSISCLYEILAFLCSEIFEEKYNSKSHMRLKLTKEYIDSNFNREFTLDFLANYSNMSVANFIREWKKYYADSPMKYRDKVRILCAKEYLLSGYYTVCEVAEKCGFADVNYFVRFFRKHTGTTPGVFKKFM